MKLEVLCTDGSPIGVTMKTLYGDGVQVGVGGAENFLLTMCETWTKLKHEVILYNNPREPNASPFEQRMISQFNPNDNRDVLIVFRSANAKAIPAKGMKLWLSCDQFTTGSFKQFSAFMDKIVVISPFHQEYFEKTYGIKNTIVTDIPVRQDDYENMQKAEKIEHRFLFSSIPDRGLDILWRMWPLIKREIPDASLVITSDYRLWGVGSANNDRHRTRWMAREGFHFLGAVPRMQLVQEQMRSQINAYPCTYDELFCVYGNNHVRTIGGVKLVKDVIQDDIILNGSGDFVRILDKYVWFSKKKKYIISSFGSPPIEVTEDHKLLCVRKRCCSHEPLSDKNKILSCGCSPEWIKASDVSVGDILLSSFPTEEIDKHWIYISSYVKNLVQIGDTLYQTHNHTKHGITYKKANIEDKIRVDKEFMTLLGYYIAEGSTSRGAVQFTFHEDEMSTMGNDVIKIVKSLFGLDVSHIKRKHAKAVQLWFSSTPLARFFELLCGKGARNKHIPEWAVELPIVKQIDLFVSMVKGDGHISKGGNKNSYSLIYTTSSHSLAYQTRDILARFGVCSSIAFRKKNNTYCVVSSGSQIIPLLELFGVEWKPTRKSNFNMWIHDGKIHTPITKIEIKESCEPTYDFTVSGNDPSFLINSKIVHNCISVAESQYAGCYTITSDLGALPTTNMGTVVKWNPLDSRGDRLFVDVIKSTLEDENFEKRVKDLQFKAWKRFNPYTIAEHWERNIFNG